MSKIKFAVVVGNDVAGVISFEENPTSESAQRFVAAYRSNPVIIETNNENVAFGWTWDGNNFIPPAGV